MNWHQNHEGIFISETYYLIRGKSFANLTWALVSLCIVFFSRKLFLIYLPVVLLMVVLAWKYKKLTRKSILIAVAFTCFMCELDVGKNGYLIQKKQDAVNFLLDWINNPDNYIAIKDKATGWSKKYTLETFETAVKKLIQVKLQ